MGAQNKKVPPFIDEDAERIIQKTRQGIGSVLLMAFGWSGLTLALLGGAVVIYDYLNRDPNVTNYSAAAPLIILSLTYLAGWVVSFVSIRVFNNLIMPIVVKAYSYGVLAGFLYVYGRAIYKIFIFQDAMKPELLPPILKYTAVMITGYLLLVSLHLLVRGFYPTPHAIILLVAVFFHLVVGVYHYVFLGNLVEGLISFDVYFLLLVLFIAFLLTRRGIYTFLRKILTLTAPALVKN